MTSEFIDIVDRSTDSFAGLVAAGEHLVWREHTYSTWAGAAMTCPASGVPVCTLHERQPTELCAGRVACPHEGSQP